AHVRSNDVFPIMLDGDHSIGYPNVRGIAPFIDGPVGIIHIDRHVDTQETDMDERMHTTPWFHATNIPNAPPVNLVQLSIGGWQAPRTASRSDAPVAPRCSPSMTSRTWASRRLPRSRSTSLGRAPRPFIGVSMSIPSTPVLSLAPAGRNQAVSCR